MEENISLIKHQQISKKFKIDYNNIRELFYEKVKDGPDDIFLISPGENTIEFTYGELKSLIKNTYGIFRRLELKNKDRISLIFHNSPEFLVLYFSALCFGLTIVPINPDIAPKEMRYIITDSKSKVIFYSNKLEFKIKNIKNLDSVKLEKITSVNDQEFSLKNEDGFEENEISVNDIAVIIYTSGTTGNPKGVILSHLNLLSDSKSISEWFHFNRKTRTLCILPLYHNNGQITTLLAPLYQGGSTVIVQGKVSLQSFWDLVNRFDVTWTSVMASILSILLSISKERKDQTLKAILCGGQILTRTIQKQFEDRFEVPIFEGYGLTETTSFSCINGFPAEKRRIGSIGKALPINEMSILDKNSKNVDENNIGEICIRGYNVTAGYLGLKEKNENSFRNGWFHSGDFGRKDSDGFFYFQGREDFLIIKGGENIYPAELENVLYQHPDIIECAVIGIPHKLLGEDVCAFVKCKEESEISETELKEFCKNNISNFKSPQKIIIINLLNDLDDIPKGPTKKILYRDLKKYYMEKYQKNSKN